MYRNRLYLYQNRQDQSNAVSIFVCILLLFSSLQQQRLRAVNGAYKNRTSTELCALFSKKLPQTGPHTHFMNVAKMWPMKAVYRTLCLVYMEPVEK